MDKYPELPEDKWPEIRRVRASNKTGWSYFEHLIKTMHTELGEEKTANILKTFMRNNAKKYVVPAMKAFGLVGNDAWSLASYFKLAPQGISLGTRRNCQGLNPMWSVINYILPACGFQIWTSRQVFAEPWDDRSLTSSPRC